MKFNVFCTLFLYDHRSVCFQKYSNLYIYQLWRSFSYFCLFYLKLIFFEMFCIQLFLFLGTKYYYLMFKSKFLSLIRSPLKIISTFLWDFFRGNWLITKTLHTGCLYRVAMIMMHFFEGKGYLHKTLNCSRLIFFEIFLT